MSDRTAGKNKDRSQPRLSCAGLHRRDAHGPLGIYASRKEGMQAVGCLETGRRRGQFLEGTRAAKNRDAEECDGIVVCRKYGKDGDVVPGFVGMGMMSSD